MTSFATQARQMIAAGATWSQIGAAFGITPDAARMRGQRRGLRTNRVGRAVAVWTPEFVASARAGMEGGATVAEMARAAGMQAAAFRVGLRRHGEGA